MDRSSKTKLFKEARSKLEKDTDFLNLIKNLRVVRFLTKINLSK